VLDGFVDVREPDQAIIGPLLENDSSRVLQVNGGAIEIAVFVRLQAEIQNQVNRRRDEGAAPGEPGRLGFFPEAAEVDGMGARPIHHVPLEQEVDFKITRLGQQELGV
jgi:hypothetical protein